MKNLTSEMCLCLASRSVFAASLRALVIRIVVIGMGGLWCISGSHGNEEDGRGFAGPIKIVKLLWNANPKSAASTLSNSLRKAVARKQLDSARAALQPLQPSLERVVQQTNRDDPRYAVALAASLIVHDDSPETRVTELNALVFKTLEKAGFSESTELLQTVWFVTQPVQAFEYFEATLRKGGESAEQISLLQAAMGANRRLAAKTLLRNWSEVHESLQVAAIEPLTSSMETMGYLLEEIKLGRVSKDLVNPNQLRKWMQAGQSDVSTQIESIWGKIRAEDNAERQRLVQQTLQLLRSGKSGSAQRGQAVFAKVCAQCHQLHGQGYIVGPNIVGNGRGSLEQLVSNVLDPSLVIGEAFQARTILTYDGEVVSGLLAGENDRFIQLKVQGGKTLEFDKEEDIELIKTSTKSLMPEGVESQMNRQEMLDLFAYLCLVRPLDAEENELIPGTPQGFVQP